jgi:hypothetical protein
MTEQGADQLHGWQISARMIGAWRRRRTLRVDQSSRLTTEAKQSQGRSDEWGMERIAWR